MKQATNDVPEGAPSNCIPQSTGVRGIYSLSRKVRNVKQATNDVHSNCIPQSTSVRGKSRKVTNKPTNSRWVWEAATWCVRHNILDSDSSPRAREIKFQFSAVFVIVRFSDSLALARASGLGNLTMFEMALC